VAILGLGQGRLQPAVVTGDRGPEIVPRLIMPVVLSIDHRVLDGADSVNFLKRFKQIMEDPDELLMSLI
jgi:pyruvate/2-oxoglutarate dehydrogenase complex dihydrolipoamide acyltransferase (E2) component